MNIGTSPRKLYVIGNGFDLHHGLHCGFADFRTWLQENRPEVYSSLNLIYGESKSDSWQDFENHLACFDLDNYPSEVNRFDLTQLKCSLNEALGKWARTTGLPPKETANVDIDREAIFFTFNYTRTLEDFYGVTEDKVIHLHGSVDNDVFVFGHDSMGDGAYDEALKDAREIGMDADLYMDMVHVKMSQEFSDVFRKPVVEIIKEHESDFNALVGIEEMIVLGLSYSDIDMPYLERIIEVTGADIKATFGYHTMEDANRASACAAALGVS